MRCQGKMCFALLCAVMLHSSVAAPVQDDFTIGNAYVNIQFDGSTGNLVNMEDKLQSTSVVDADLSPGSPPPPSVDLWGLSLVGAGGELAVTGRGTVAAGLSRDAGSQVLSIVWSGVGVAASQGNGTQDVALLDVRLSVALPDDSAVSAWQLGLTVREIHSPVASIGVWEASINVPAGIADAEDGELFYPRGFGVTYSNPRASAGPSLSSTYPSGSASMQYMSTGRRSLASGLFMAAMDPVGEAKNMDYAAPSSEAASYLRIKIFPEGAGVPIPVGGSWAAPFAVSVGAISGIDAAAGRPMWVEGALLYKRWALQSARWTRDGPLAARPKEFPAWFTDNSVWINSHWQCHDIFNATGGDPHFVLPYVTEIAARLGEPSLSLHWYEWQQGPDPSEEARYKFDTHYPDYFPARTDFKTAVAALKAINVSTFPYINGRISDIRADSFAADNAEQYCTKATRASVVDEAAPRPLVPYIETYGSDASFCVTNPFTSYWQAKTADIVEELVFDYEVSGVYIDQIASAKPKLCWDSAHDHSLGNGAYWTEGYDAMMSAVGARLQGTTARPMVTEDNAEPYLHMLQGFLTLNAFKDSLAQGTTGTLPSTSRLSPAFPMIYGGYYVGFGAIWSRDDFYDHDWWCARVSSMLVTGSQLGWFSLAGVEDDPEDSCGPMGVGDLMLAEENDDLIDFLRLAARSRAAVVEYMLHGHIARPAVLDPQPQILKAAANGNLFDYDVVVSGAWNQPETGAVLVILAAATPTAYSGSLVVSFSNWGFDDVESLSVNIINIHGEKKQLGAVSGPDAFWDVTVPGRSVVMLEFSPHTAYQ